MRLRTMAAVGIGYILGTRAGQQRYDDMQRLYHRAVESDAFDQIVQQIKASLGEGVRMVTGTTPGWATSEEEPGSGGARTTAQEEVGEATDDEDTEEESGTT